MKTGDRENEWPSVQSDDWSGDLAFSFARVAAV